MESEANGAIIQLPRFTPTSRLTVAVSWLADRSPHQYLSPLQMLAELKPRRYCRQCGHRHGPMTPVRPRECVISTFNRTPFCGTMSSNCHIYDSIGIWPSRRLLLSSRSMFRVHRPSISTQTSRIPRSVKHLYPFVLSSLFKTVLI